MKMLHRRRRGVFHHSLTVYIRPSSVVLSVAGHDGSELAVIFDIGPSRQQRHLRGKGTVEKGGWSDELELK